MPQAFRDAPPASLVLIGPPPLEALAPLIAAAPGAVVLVEPNPDLAVRMERQFASRESVKVLPFGIDAAPGHADLSSFNFPGLRSLRRPTPALRALLPGLQLRSSLHVEVITPAELIARIGPLPRPQHLWIDAPGAEMAILQGLLEAGALERIDRIRLRCPAEEMFEGGSSVANLRNWAEAEGLRMIAEDLHDPDWPELTFEIDVVAQQLRKTREELDRQVARAEALEAQGAEQARQCERLEAQRAAIEAEAGAAQAALADRLTAMEARAQSAETALKRSEIRVKTLEVERSAQAQAREAAQQALNGSKAETATLREALTAMETRAKTAESILSQRATRMEDAEAAQKRMAEKLEQKDLDLGVAMRSQAAAQSDLLDLRGRFEALQTEKQTLDALLRRVTSRLSAASDHLHMLAAMPTEPTPSDSAAPAIDAVPTEARTAEGKGEDRP
ncbi:FkbM family methyltransferase [Rhodobacter maris]|uniref:FkbM family methyltransferase n=1 Tax=Rhodobacter maris TaxID=446682 RepID=A0A285SG40_9RHOB|nr:FkbM family methyltransferase [Rhodobacter maris]SOC06902.1 FkbM family methyltransferase [Rhodobacter maris]